MSRDFEQSRTLLRHGEYKPDSFGLLGDNDELAFLLELFALVAVAVRGPPAVDVSLFGLLPAAARGTLPELLLFKLGKRPPKDIIIFASGELPTSPLTNRRGTPAVSNSSVKRRRCESFLLSRSGSCTMTA
jgi:hypothetical protein